MTLKQLEAFYWAAKLGTLTIAAQRLHVTQSSLSKRIAELEAFLGEPLFDKSAKRASLTSAGEILLVKAQQILELASDVRAGRLGDEELAGTCHFGVSELSATTWFPGFVNRLHEDHPNLVPKPQVGLGRNLERLVERGELDFAVIAGVASSEAVASRVIAEVEFAWMLSPARMRAMRRRRARPIAGHPVISSTADSSLHLAVGGWAASARIDVGQTISCNSLTATVGMTVAGVGISCLPRRYVATLVRRKLLVAVGEAARPLTLPYSFIWRRDDSRRLVAEMRQRVLDQADFGTPNVLWA